MTPPRELYVPKSRPKSIYDDPLRAYGYNYAGISNLFYIFFIFLKGRSL